MGNSDHINMERVTISIGKLRYLYKLKPEPAHQLADVLGAVFNSETLCTYKGETYSKAQFDLIANDLRVKGNNLPNKRPQVSCHADGSKSIFLFPDDGLYHWAAGTYNLEDLIKEGYRESIGKEYKRPPTDCFAKLNYYRENNPLVALSLALLDTAVVDMKKALKCLKDEDYTPPDRQHFDEHPTLGFTWGEFRRILKLAHAAPMPQGGSRPQSSKIEATTAMCVQVQKYFIESNPPPNSLGIDTFCERVESEMLNSGQSDLYQSSTAKKFFRKSNVLEEYKMRRGRPRKKA